ncbi:hypothetical protein ACTXKQ_09350 [Corynebacterium variabile]|uniref:Secreted protein n=1 Tax=Corynebacterium variabile TaxID=1727 RepID=A0A0X2NM98_9CORY|nr:hypothetical protein [Corynebacterium variabile]CUU66594.1 hypothetical protein CVAR292_01941 [Corynebacterium variabile]
MRRNFLSSTAALAAAAGLALTLTACDGEDNSASPTPEDVVVTVTETAERPAPTKTTEESIAELPSPTRSPSAQSADSALGNTPRSAADIAERPQERPILRNSKDFDFLEFGDYLEPGAKYHTDDGSCSFGWLVGMESGGPTSSLTAGHCGNVGDTVYVDTSSGDTIPVGEFIWQAFDGEANIGTGNDYAIIRFYDDVLYATLGTPEVTFDDVPVELAGWRDAAWLEQNKPYMCRLGYRSGLSCGTFQEMTNSNTVMFDNISDHGDSGGAIWAVDPADPTGSKIYAVAVNSFGNENDATSAGGKTIDQVMGHFDLTIYN